MQYFPHNSDKFQSFIPERELEKIDEATKKMVFRFSRVIGMQKEPELWEDEVL